MHLRHALRSSGATTGSGRRANFLDPPVGVLAVARKLADVSGNTGDWDPAGQLDRVLPLGKWSAIQTSTGGPSGPQKKLREFV